MGSSSAYNRKEFSMQREGNSKDSVDQNSTTDRKSRAARIVEERMEKRRRKASLWKLISYIVALIAVRILMLWLRRAGL